MEVSMKVLGDYSEEMETGQIKRAETILLARLFLIFNYFTLTSTALTALRKRYSPLKGL